MTMIELDQVTKSYVTKDGERKAVENITFSVEQGQFVSLVGPSGCGKTSLLSIMAGLIPPSEGNILIQGEPVTKPSSKIGYMLQQDYLLNWRTIKENIVLGLEIQGKLTRETEAHALYLLAEMGLDQYADRYPHELSGGMRQRVALVRTLATNPDLLLLDEPFSALDYQTKLKLEDLVVTTLRRHEKSAILVTHDISEAIAMSDMVIILGKNPGRIKDILSIPESIRMKLPFEAREHESFKTYFNRIWKEMNEDDHL